MSQFKTMDGNEACSYVSYFFTEVAGIYPITPASNMAERVDERASLGELNFFNAPVKVVQMQSEAGAAAMVHGSLQMGALSTTYTSSQGLLLMIPNMYKMAGEMLPAVIHVASRSLASHALSILGDHQDVYAVRSTGFAIFAASSVQEVMDLTPISHLSAIKGQIPFINFFDGFRTSSELQKVKVWDKEDLRSLLDMELINRFKERSLTVKPKTMGTSQNDDVYFQNIEVRNPYYDELPNIVNEYLVKINEKLGTDYKPFNYYGHPEADKVIIAMGSVCETIKETIDTLNSNGAKLGLIVVRLYRPFSTKYLLDVLPKSVTKVAVLDRTKEPGSIGEPLYLDVVSALRDDACEIKIYGGRYGLSSKNVDPSQIKAIYDFLDNNPHHNFTIGINDDVTNLSIPMSDFKINTNNLEVLIYGYGSDGMISAAKDMIKMVSDKTAAYAQGYFQYDSKKSGGVTRSHIRIGKEPIRETYYVTNPRVVVCTKESYLNQYDVLGNMVNGGIFLFVTDLKGEALISSLPNKIKKLIANKGINFYTIDAYAIAEKHNLKNKISMIMEKAMFEITKILPSDYVSQMMQESIKTLFAKKGEEVINNNINTLNEVKDALTLIQVDNNWKDLIEEEVSYPYDNKLFNYMNSLKGDDLKVSDFNNTIDGNFPVATSQYEKRSIANNVPIWDKDICIQCNRCTIVCPHAVIRPVVLTKEEVTKYGLEGQVLEYLGNKDYFYYLHVSKADCTECGLCINTCIGKQGAKALHMEPNLVTKEHIDLTNKLFNEVSDKKLMPINSVKGSQFPKPLFEFSGACAGCGETPYLKLLTQLFGEQIIIANATGCSSIYGGSSPSTPYSVSWANSLFEDNAEFGFGMKIAFDNQRNNLINKVKEIMPSLNNEEQMKWQLWLDNLDNNEIINTINIDWNNLPSEIVNLKSYFQNKNIWMVGGDGWAYDIGFGGLDHVMSGNQNINILVLNTEVYSNTGGQSSKASDQGSIAKFTAKGKLNPKKDLARMLLAYPNAYVAQVSLGADMNQTVKALIEAGNYDGPSIIIAYSPCISHGIKDGLGQMIENEKLATTSGYFPIFRYLPWEEKFILDKLNPNFDLYESFLKTQNRYVLLEKVNKEAAVSLLEGNKEAAKKRYQYYEMLHNLNKN